MTFEAEKYMGLEKRDESDWPKYTKGVDPSKNPPPQSDPPPHVHIPSSAIDAEVEFHMRQFQIVTAALAIGLAAGMLGLATQYQILACVTAPVGFALGGLSMMVIHRIKDTFKK